MQAKWNGAIIAESDETIVVEGNHYFPPGSLNKAYFEASNHSSVCPWKGVAGYMHVVVDGQRNSDAAWFYPETKPEADSIRGYVAFWKGVAVS